MAKNARRLLIIRPGGIGDCLLSFGLFYYIKKNNPNYSIFLHTSTQIAKLAAENNIVDEIADSKWYNYLYTNLNMLEEEWDKIICIIRGLSIQHDKIKVIDPTITDDIELAYPTFLIKRLYSEALPLPYIRLHSRSSLNIAKRYINQINTDKYIVIFPGSGNKIKNWPVENFLHVIQSLDKEMGIVVLLGENERDLEKYFLNIRRKRYKVYKMLPLGVVLEIIKTAKIFIGNDTGISHLASMTGVSTIILYGPTKSNIWRWPCSNLIQVVSSKECAGCSIFRVKCKFPEADCMKYISFEEVFELIQKHLNL